MKTRELTLPESIAVEQQWRGIYGDAFVGRSRVRVGVKAESEFSRIACDHYWVIPFNFNVAGTAIRVNRYHQNGFECRGDLLALGEFHNIELFICPVDFAWTMVHTHEDHALGGPYFQRREWIDG